MRILIAFVIVALFFQAQTVAQTVGNGCNLGNVVYTQYLGMDNAYGGSPQPTYQMPGPYYTINFNGYSATQPNNENYICGQINYYDSPVYRHDYTSYGVSCVTEATLHGAVNGNGTHVQYKVNDPSKCGTTNVPMDDYYVLIPFMIVVASFAIILLRKNSDVNHS